MAYATVESTFKILRGIVVHTHRILTIGLLLLLGWQMSGWSWVESSWMAFCGPIHVDDQPPVESEGAVEVWDGQWEPFEECSPAGGSVPLHRFPEIFQSPEALRTHPPMLEASVFHPPTLL